MPAAAITPSVVEKATKAIRWLADCCDWARTQDGKGFSGVDAPLGHALAGKELWSPRETFAACKLIVKYKKQLIKGGVDVSGVQESIPAQEKALGSGAHGKMGRRDVVKGQVSVNQDGRIQLYTSYHDRIVQVERELVGAKFDHENKVWTCDPTGENAVDAMAIAEEFGLTVHEADRKRLAEMASTRKVAVDGSGLLVVEGVNAGKVISSQPSLLGRPELDEKNFAGLQWVAPTAIGIPLRSWVIRDAVLWLSTADEGDVNARRLEWAKDEILCVLEKQYPAALADEREAFIRASASSLPDGEELTKIREALPEALANGLMPHQWVAAKAVAERREILLCDEQGLGKTVEVLAGLEAAQAFPAVVLAPATALLNWRDEAVRWLPHRRVAVMGGSVGKRDSGVPLEQADIAILNYEFFSKNANALGRFAPLALVADEAQYLKGHGSERTKAVKEFLRKSTSMRKVVAATGTPVMNRPAEMLTLLTLMPGLLASLGGFVRFASRYCQATLERVSFSREYWDYSGATHLGELANRIRETGAFVRRVKSEVLPQLPPKVRQVVMVEIANRAEYELARDDLSEWLKTQNRPIRHKPSKVRPHDEDESHLQNALRALGWDEEDVQALGLDANSRAEALKRVGALRRLTGIGKTPGAIRWIKENVKDEKLVVFAYHIEVQETLLAALKADGITSLSITGEMTTSARHSAIKSFTSDPNAQVIVCSIKATQTAVNLQVARRVLTVELDWTPAALDQAEDRTHRIGQTAEVQITYLHAEGTMDDRMAEILDAKRERISLISGANAQYGYRKDGKPRLQPPGTGRPRLEDAERERRRKASKAGWQGRNLDYMRDYMRKRRLEKRIADARPALEELRMLEDLGYEGMRSKYGYRSGYRLEDFECDLAEARDKADRAKELLGKLDAPVDGN